MANWDNISQRGDVEDMRGAGLGSIAGIGGVGTIVAFAIMLFGGDANVANLVGGLVDQVAPQTQTTQNSFNDPTNYQDFAAKIIGSTNSVFSEQFSNLNKTYTYPKLVLFRNYTPSGCGGAYSEYGPHYCPNDSKIYLDETFFDQLQKQYGGSNSKVAQAYVIAHEVGHNIQNNLNLVSSNSNAESVQTELQADCLAGVWTGYIQNQGVIEKSEFLDAVSAAEAVGDDHIQKTAGQRVNPESWTHGSSAQRVEALEIGYNSKNIQTCLEKY